MYYNGVGMPIQKDLVIFFFEISSPNTCQAKANKIGHDSGRSPDANYCEHAEFRSTSS